MKQKHIPPKRWPYDLGATRPRRSQILTSGENLQSGARRSRGETDGDKSLGGVGGSCPGSNSFSSFSSLCFSSLSFHCSLQLFLSLVSEFFYLFPHISLHLALDYSLDCSINLSPPFSYCLLTLLFNCSSVFSSIVS